MRALFPFFAILILGGSASTQTRTQPRPAPSPVRNNKKIPDVVPVKEPVQSTNASDDRGTINGHTYANTKLGFEITFPDPWLIAGDDLTDLGRKHGIDLSLKAPEALPAVSKAQMNKALENVTLLLTAYRPGGTGDNAVVRISVEDLSLQPQIKDGVDYLDAVRSSYAAMDLPAGFEYSETNAEQLKSGQFAFLDITQQGVKKRLYVTVRGTKAILLTVTYTKTEDLAAFRSILGSADFRLVR